MLPRSSIERAPVETLDVPKLVDCREPLGVPHVGWFHTLMNSACRLTATLSLMGISFERAMFWVKTCGPCRNVTLPIVPGVVFGARIEVFEVPPFAPP